MTGGEGTVLEQEAQRGISLSRTIGGMGRIDGWLTPTAFQTLHTTLDALMPPPSSDDHRTARQRRHDALEDLAREFLDHGNTPTVGGERPHINVIVDWEAMNGIAGGRHEYETGEVLDLTTLRALACDSTVARIVFGPESEVMDVGRKTRVIPSALRRAIVARDRHCTWPGGCDRGPRWCDIHHIHHWADGGGTQPDNLTLLCRHHHTRTHRGEGRSPPGRS